MVEQIPSTLEPTAPRFILVVDDEARMRRFIRMNMELEGYQLIEADNGVDALEKIRQHTPDLVIMDVMMPQMDGFETLRLLREIHYEASRANLYPELVLAVIEVESNFNQFAISHAGALGLMQVMPFWLKEIGRPNDNLFNLKTNLRMGCTILRYYLDMEKGDLTQALARYNGSKGSSRYSNKVFAALNKRWRKY